MQLAQLNQLEIGFSTEIFLDPKLGCLYSKPDNYETLYILGSLCIVVFFTQDKIEHKIVKAQSLIMFGGSLQKSIFSLLLNTEIPI